MQKLILSLLVLFFSQQISAQTQQEMNNQAMNDHKKADADMTRVYKQVMNGLSTPTAKNMLLEAQRAWIKYKESHCKALANEYEGGSIYPLILYSCLEELTIERKKQLQRYLQN